MHFIRMLYMYVINYIKYICTYIEMCRNTYRYNNAVIVFTHCADSNNMYNIYVCRHYRFVSCFFLNSKLRNVDAEIFKLQNN